MRRISVIKSLGFKGIEGFKRLKDLKLSLYIGASAPFFVDWILGLGMPCR